MAIVYEKKNAFSSPPKTHTLRGERGSGEGGKPPSLNSQQLGRVGSSLEAGKSPLPSPVQMGEVRLRLAAAQPRQPFPPLHFPNFPFPLRRG